MYLSVIDVKPLDDYVLWLRFETGEEKTFDVNPYLTMGTFKELKDVTLFRTARVCFDTIERGNQLDLDPEVLYQDSVFYIHSRAEQEKEGFFKERDGSDIVHLMVENKLDSERDLNPRYDKFASDAMYDSLAHRIEEERNV